MKTEHIISAVSSAIFLAILCLPFYFLSFWWAVLVDYCILACLILVFVFELARSNREYDEMIEREFNKKVF